MNPLNWLGYVVVGLLSFSLVFWLTWPSEAIGNRIRHEVRQATEGDVDLTMAQTSPRWGGMAASDVMVRRRVAGGEVFEPFFAMDGLQAKVSLWSLFGEPEVSLGVQLDDGSVDGTFVWSGLGPKAKLLQALVRGSRLPVEDLLGLGRGLELDVPLTATGGLDVHTNLALGSGWSEAVGDVSLRGRKLHLHKLAVPQMGELELDTPFDTLDLGFRLEGGRAEVVDGTVRTSLADVDIRGEIELADRLLRSRLDLTVVLTLRDWDGSPLESFRSMIEKQLDVAKGDDGRYHYTLKGILGRLSMSSLRPDRSVRRMNRSKASSPEPSTQQLPRSPARRAPRNRISDEARDIARRLPPAQRRASEARRAERAKAEEDELDEERFDEEGFDELDGELEGELDREMEDDLLDDEVLDEEEEALEAFDEQY